MLIRKLPKRIRDHINREENSIFGNLENLRMSIETNIGQATEHLEDNSRANSFVSTITCDVCKETVLPVILRTHMFRNVSFVKASNCSKLYSKF